MALQFNCTQAKGYDNIKARSLYNCQIVKNMVNIKRIKYEHNIPGKHKTDATLVFRCFLWSVKVLQQAHGTPKITAAKCTSLPKFRLGISDSIIIRERFLDNFHLNDKKG
jgi:hypothetical protein